MNVDVLALIALAIGIASAAVVIVRRFPTLRMLDVANLPGQRHAQVKSAIIAQRLRRKLQTAAHWTAHHLAPLHAHARRAARRLVERMETMEREYRHRAQQLRPVADAETARRVEALLEEAETFRKEGHVQRAEQKYIEVISIDPHSVEAFRGLGEFYLAQKEYAHAEESLEHVLKLAPKDAHLLLDLADVARANGDFTLVLRRCQQAAAVEPNDPKTLDALLEASIATAERELAERTLSQLEQVNPENQKLATFRAQIAELPHVRPAAERKAAAAHTVPKPPEHVPEQPSASARQK